MSTSVPMKSSQEIPDHLCINNALPQIHIHLITCVLNSIICHSWAHAAMKVAQRMCVQNLSAALSTVCVLSACGSSSNCGELTRQATYTS